MLNLYYDPANGSVLSYATLPALDASPPDGQAVIGIPDGVPFLNAAGQVAVQINLTATPPAVTFIGS